MYELVPDVLRLIFQQLAGDNTSLLNVSLTCRAWRSLALPSVFQVVDISSHNNGRLPQLECEFRPLIYADYDGEYRPENLVSRQRAFLRLVTDKPELASYVKSFTWTLIWLDFDEDELTEIDLQTWNVFGRMINVTHLDLASLHHVDEVVSGDYIRQNPTTLFPKVRDLRLLGWMHRGLVRAIINSLESDKLRSLALDYLVDEGAHPNGDPLGADFAIRHAHNAGSKGGSRRPGPRSNDGSKVIDNDLITRQETGNAFIFPGPMWLPLHLLSAHAMDSLTHLQVKVPPWDRNIDLRNYNTMFRQTASFIAKTRESLKSLIVVLGSSTSFNTGHQDSGCGTARLNLRHYYRPWGVQMAKLYLEQLLAALNENAFPVLEEIRFEGFDILVQTDPFAIQYPDTADILQLVRGSRFTNASLTEISSVQGRHTYIGHHSNTNDDGRVTELLAIS